MTFRTAVLAGAQKFEYAFRNLVRVCLLTGPLFTQLVHLQSFLFYIVLLSRGLLLEIFLKTLF